VSDINDANSIETTILYWCRCN